MYTGRQRDGTTAPSLQSDQLNISMLPPVDAHRMPTARWWPVAAQTMWKPSVSWMALTRLGLGVGLGLGLALGLGLGWGWGWGQG